MAFCQLGHHLSPHVITWRIFPGVSSQKNGSPLELQGICRFYWCCWWFLLSWVWPPGCGFLVTIRVVTCLGSGIPTETFNLPPFSSWGPARPEFNPPFETPLGIRTTLMSDCWYKGCNIKTSQQDSPSNRSHGGKQATFDTKNPQASNKSTSIFRVAAAVGFFWGGKIMCLGWKNWLFCPDLDPCIKKGKHLQFILDEKLQQQQQILQGFGGWREMSPREPAIFLVCVLT